MYKLLFIIFVIFACVNSQESICDRYTPDGDTNADFLTGFVVAAFGRLVEEGAVTRPYFTGEIGSTIDYTSNEEALGDLAAGLVAFFGGALGCSDGTTGTYAGATMDIVHEDNEIDKAAWEWFNQQLVVVAQVAGFAHDDQVALSTALESFRAQICTQDDCFEPPFTITVGQGGRFFNPPGGYSFPAPTSITFVFLDDSLQHSVVQNDGTGTNNCAALSGGFNSASRTGPSNFTQTFDTPGTYGFFCSVGTHCATNNMYGTLTITAGQSTTAASTASTAATTSGSTSGTTSGGGTTGGRPSSAASIVFSFALLLPIALLF